jgi:Peptidase family M28
MRFAPLVTVALLSILAGFPAEAKTVEQSLRDHIAVLASDEYEGRAPGTAGEQKTLGYIMAAWQKAGLKPGADNESWFAPVPLLQRGPLASKFSFSTKEKTLRFIADEIILIGREESYQKKALPLVFGGYGIKADGTAIDGVAGKAVLMLFDQPDSAPATMRSPRARREALVKAGAEAVFVVADNGQGNWAAIRRQLLSRPIALQTRETRAPLEGAISSEFAVGMVTAAGRDWDKLRASAKAPNFATQDLGINGDFDVTTNIRRFESQNVIGKIAGKKKGSGAVLFMAHWDHLGICEPESAEDKICNGAVDNASGIAVLTEVARGLAKSRQDRDMYFVATTAEESGLLGAYAFADKPPVPLDQIVAALNVDTIAVAPAGAKVAIIARGMTALDPTVDGVVKKLGRKVESSTAANSFVQRQDGWALTQKGVPAIMVGGSFSDLGKMQAFLESDYHGPNDELTDKTILSGAAEDVALHIELGRTFASQRKYMPEAKAK